MRTVIVRDAMRIPLGKQGENNAVRVVWPEIAEKYAKLYGEGRFELVVVQRGQVYPAVVNVDGADLVWDVRAADTATAEVGSLELIYYVGDTIAKSQTWETVVVASASAAGTTEPPEDPARVWFDEIKRQIGDLGKLTTKAKENLVGAINEAAQTSSGGADWAQNDPNAKDYIKNRTHYISRESKALVPEQEVTTAVQNNFNVAMLNNADLDALQKLYDSKDDTTFDVVFDGASYQCKWLEPGGSRIPVFGNLAMFNPDMTDTGEPFCVELNRKDLWIGCKVAGTHTVAVSCQQDVVHTLDHKYIKDMYYAESEEQPLVPEVEIDTSWNGDYTDRIQADCPSEGQTIIVTYDGVKYERKAQIFMGYVVVGNTALSGAGTTTTDTGEQFYLRFWETYCGVEMVFMNARLADDTTSHTLSAVTIVEQVHTIPNKYISAEIPRKSDIPASVQSDWNETSRDSMAFIKNKPVIQNYVGITYVSASSTVVEMSTDNSILLVFTQNSGARVPLVRVFYAETYYTTISSKTGKALTKDECPYDCMVLVRYGIRFYCVNPL